MQMNNTGHSRKGDESHEIRFEHPQKCRDYGHGQTPAKEIACCAMFKQENIIQ